MSQDTPYAPTPEYGGAPPAPASVKVNDELSAPPQMSPFARLGNVFFSPGEEFSEGNVARIVSSLTPRSVTHLILDSLGEAFALEGLNENADVEVAPWLRRVCRRIITDTGAGITLVDHGTKAAEKPLDPSGSKRKKAAITGTAWLMTTGTPFTKADGGRAAVRLSGKPPMLLDTIRFPDRIHWRPSIESMASDRYSSPRADIPLPLHRRRRAVAAQARHP